MTPSQGLQEKAIDRFWETVPPLWSEIRAHIRAEATGKFDISVEQFHVLRHVRRGKSSVSDLAIEKNISRPAVSQAVEILVQKRLLTRVRSKKDRRYVELALTQDGNDLLDAVFTENRAWMKQRMNALTTNELETVIRAMEAMKKILG
jgi:DNA-binding MarR family transcriptional regulator